MAAKKRKAAKRKKRSSKGKRKSAKYKLADAMGIDPNSLEQMLRQVFPGGFGGAADASAGEIMPMEMVQEIKRLADEAEDKVVVRKDFVALPDNVDVILSAASSTSSASEALPFYEKAVAAGERTIGKKAFREWTGDFWGGVKRVPTCGQSRDWPSAFGPSADARRPSSIFRTCYA